jgi:hypothetical protein
MSYFLATAIRPVPHCKLAKVTPCVLALVALPVLACWSGGAFGQVLSEFPKGYRGAWCSASREGDDENIYRRCRGEEGGLFIAARRFTEGEEDNGLEDCVPVHAIRTNYGDLIVQAVCLKEDGSRNLLDQRWKLLKGGRRLQISGGRGVPLPDLMRGLDPRP